MIEIDPNEPTNYFALCQDLRGRGPLRRGRSGAVKASEVKPNDPQVYTHLSGFYNRQGEFEKTMDALNRRPSSRPNNPQGYQLIATFYWEKAYKDKRLSPAPAEGLHRSRASRPTDKALSLNPDYAEALDLQEHPASHAGEPRDRSGQARQA